MPPALPTRASHGRGDVTTATARASHAGGVRPRRFLALIVPSGLAAVGVGAAIILGYLSLQITAARPIAMGSSGGSADSVVMTLGTMATVVETDTYKKAHDAAAVLDVQGAEFDNLCMVPRIRLPLLGTRLNVRLNLNSAVKVPDVSMSAVGHNALGTLSLPATRVGGVAPQGAPGATPGGFSVFTLPSGDDVDMTGVDVYANGLNIRDGIRLRRASLSFSLQDDLKCSTAASPVDVVSASR